MPTKRMDIPDDVHKEIVEYAADYGHRSLAGALAEMVRRAMVESEDDRLDLRQRKADRQALLTGTRKPSPATARRRRAAQKAQDAPQSDGTADSGEDTAPDPADAPEAPVASENGEYAHQ